MPTSAAPIEPAGGFTLLEVLASIALLGVLALLFAAVWRGSSRVSELLTEEASALEMRRDAIHLQLADPAATPILRLRSDPPDASGLIPRSIPP